MARGQKLKQEVAQKILLTFENSFLYNDGKEIRICGEEDGEQIQIKVTLTAAKENVNIGQDNALPGEGIKINEGINFEENKKIIEPTEAEKQNVNDLLKALGL